MKSVTWQFKSKKSSLLLGEWPTEKLKGAPKGGKSRFQGGRLYCEVSKTRTWKSPLRGTWQSWKERKNVHQKKSKNHKEHLVSLNTTLQAKQSETSAQVQLP